ncbi:hypothetical protein ACFO4E_04145 [Nocardiopsis mangrovi]|uniref:Uncharacterized protein n=1 Tax=Nocardiopsis mangrovi TaxID=1179818 RepID=A0ABV9DRG0_9ACTN
MGVRVEPGSQGSPSQRHLAEELQRRHTDELNSVREQADKWRQGLSGIIGITTIIAAAGGLGLAEGLDTIPRIAAAILLLLAMVLSSSGGFFAMRAAHGFPRRRQTEATLEELVDREQKRLRRSCVDLRKTVLLTYLSLAFLVAAIGVTWFS